MCPVWKQIRREKSSIEAQDLVRTLFTTRNAGQGARTSYPSSTSLRSQPNSDSHSPRKVERNLKRAEERIPWIYFPVGTESTGISTFVENYPLIKQFHITSH